MFVRRARRGRHCDRRTWKAWRRSAPRSTADTTTSKPEGKAHCTGRRGSPAFARRVTPAATVAGVSGGYELHAAAYTDLDGIWKFIGGANDRRCRRRNGTSRARQGRRDDSRDNRVTTSRRLRFRWWPIPGTSARQWPQDRRYMPRAGAAASTWLPACPLRWRRVVRAAQCEDTGKGPRVRRYYAADTILVTEALADARSGIPRSKSRDVSSREQNGAAKWNGRQSWRSTALTIDRTSRSPSRPACAGDCRYRGGRINAFARLG